MTTTVEHPSSSSVEDRLELLLRAALSKKAFRPVIIKLEGLTSLTDYFVILSARSPRQVTAVAEAVLEVSRKARIERYSVEGVRQGSWALLDFGDIVFHVFDRPVRDFYDLEGLWAEAPRVRPSEELQKEIEESEEETGDAFEDEDEWD